MLTAREKTATASLGNRLTDWALSIFSPERFAVRRHEARMDEDAAYRSTWMERQERLFAYRAAGLSATATPWMDDDRDVNKHIRESARLLRGRSQELNRDDPVGTGLTNTFVDNVVGTGIRPQAQTGDDKLNERIESVWSDRRDHLFQADHLTYAEGQQLLFRKLLEDGDVLRKAVKQPGEPIWFETVEASRVCTPMGEESRIGDGVERDSVGRPVAYWVLKGGSGSAGILQKANFERVPVQFARLYKRTERPGQTRGVPLFHAVLQDMRDFDLLMLASLKRTQIGACLTGIITSDKRLTDTTQAKEEKYGYISKASLEPGRFWKAYPGESVTFTAPNFPTPELGAFIVAIARRIGAALGVSWQLVLRDFSNSSYSSARTDLLQSQITFTRYQRHLVETVLNWEWTTVLEDAKYEADPRLSGVPAAVFRQVHWIPAGWDWVDPRNQAQATQLMLNMGATTLQQVCGSRGLDWEEVLKQRVTERKREQELVEAAGLDGTTNDDTEN